MKLSFTKYQFSFMHNECMAEKNIEGTHKFFELYTNFQSWITKITKFYINKKITVTFSGLWLLKVQIEKAFYAWV